MSQPRHFIIRSDIQRERASKHVWHVPEGWEVIIRPHKSKRSLQQNACMWAMLAAAGDEIGYSPAELHELAKAERFGVREVEVPKSRGKTLKIINGSTTKLSVQEMSLYLDWLQVWLTDNAGIDAYSLRKSYGV
jgi:hypothetical protein